MACTYFRFEVDGLSFQATRADNGDVALLTDGFEGVEGTPMAEGHLSASTANLLGLALIAMAKEDWDE